MYRASVTARPLPTSIADMPNVVPNNPSRETKIRSGCQVCDALRPGSALSTRTTFSRPRRIGAFAIRTTPSSARMPGSVSPNPMPVIADAASCSAAASDARAAAGSRSPEVPQV